MGTEDFIPESIFTVLGELRCVVVSHPRSQVPHLAVVLCHGYGAPGHDLVPLGGAGSLRVSGGAGEPGFGRLS